MYMCYIFLKPPIMPLSKRFYTGKAEKIVEHATSKLKNKYVDMSK